MENQTVQKLKTNYSIVIQYDRGNDTILSDIPFKLKVKHNKIILSHCYEALSLTLRHLESFIQDER